MGQRRRGRLRARARPGPAPLEAATWAETIGARRVEVYDIMRLYDPLYIFLLSSSTLITFFL